MKEVAQEHTKADRLIAKTFDQNPTVRPCCRAGCSACCSEALFASNAEVEHILEALTPEQLAELKAKLPAWLEATRPMMKHKDIHAGNFAVAYRRLNVPCVFLKNGLCSIYARRPFGCRAFFALKNPFNCNLPEREHQKFAIFGDDFYRALGGEFIFVDGNFILDHLGVLLAERLLDIKCPSAARTTDTAERFQKLAGL